MRAQNHSRGQWEHIVPFRTSMAVVSYTFAYCSFLRYAHLCKRYLVNCHSNSENGDLIPSSQGAHVWRCEGTKSSWIEPGHVVAAVQLI